MTNQGSPPRRVARGARRSFDRERRPRPCVMLQDAHGNPHVEIAAVSVLLDLRTFSDRNMQPQTRILLANAPQNPGDRGGPKIIRDGEAQVAGHQRALHVLPRDIAEEQQLPRMDHKPVARRRKTRAVLAANKQWNPAKLVELTDLFADRGLRPPKPQRRRRKAFLLRHGHKRIQQIEVEAAHFNPS